MLDIVSRIQQLVDKEKPFALARVIKTWRSSPRPVGSAMAVTAKGEMIGSVSGGCVENAVVKKAIEVLNSGVPEVVEFGIADDDAWEVGLSCGGALTVLITPFMEDDGWSKFNEFLTEQLDFFLLTPLSGGRNSNPILMEHLDDELPDNPVLKQNITDAYKDGLPGAIVESRVGDEYFVHFFRKKPLLLLIGSAHITAELLVLAKMFGFESVVIDPRDTFAKKTDMPQQPDQLLVKWPQQVLKGFPLTKNTYVVILSHDPKIDDEALKIVLPSQVKYVGALGSKKTHQRRVIRLEDYGFTAPQIERIDAPIGIPIGSQTPKEIALSVMAGIIKAKNL
ncbi:xanthine dehydrogenase accessory factor [Roseivirga pacifica]|uniref:Xanthine dehydrogenase accessory factor n=1 Tax=Roseivirga pacifica TaxID=1267423 RepID=A0A1I0Q3Y9_9BACT|nr:XdhC family protein [Roseivirga pacifica]RKQ43295.1 xanthine dehydrogenase accessory factor [Roseivirga pacifica]SEW21251.1 xanthine dehydrogenase accessory factor [Roseivirga pacifica]